jgi:hypothetical protein
LQIENENLAIADLAGIGGFFDRLDSLIKNVVLDGRFAIFTFGRKSTTYSAPR